MAFDVAPADRNAMHPQDVVGSGDVEVLGIEKDRMKVSDVKASLRGPI